MVADLVGEYLGGEFPAQVLGRTHRRYRAPQGAGDRFAHLLDFADLNEILAAQRLEPPRLRLTRDGQSVPVEDYTVRRSYRRMASWSAPIPHRLAAQLREGASLVIDAIDEMHPPIRLLALGIERRLRTKVQVNAYFSTTAREGFGVHYDDHDVIVLQIAGAKRWRLYGPTRLAPLYRDVTFDPVPPSQPIVEFTLQAGDILHVPRGCWHAATASTGQPSLHLTCGLVPHTGIDLLTWLVDELRADVVARSDIPRFSTPADQAAWQDHVALLIRARLADPHLIAAYQHSRDTADTGRAGFSLPLSTGDLPIPPGTCVRMTCPRAVVTDQPNGVVLEAAGQRWTLAAAARPLLAQLTAGQPVRAEDLAAATEISVASIAELFRRLLDGGVITVETSSTAARSTRTDTVIGGAP